MSRSRRLFAVCLLEAACAHSTGARAPPRSAAIHIALTALETARGAEAPRALVASIDHLTGGSATGSVRVHLRSPRTRVRAARLEDGWRIDVTLPDVSDHVHTVELRWRSADAPPEVRVDSRN